jgi:hypothetical protein
MEAGCFVLILNPYSPEDFEHFSTGAWLRLYENQEVLYESDNDPH